MTKKHFKLQHSESVVVQAAAQIYAAYISAGRVPEGEQTQWMECLNPRGNYDRRSNGQCRDQR